MKNRNFSLEDQDNFAKLSGDYNPMHVDPVMARRLMFGKPVVHGIHMLLWALDSCLIDNDRPQALASIKAAFLKPLGVDEEITCSNTIHAGKIKIKLLKDERQIAFINAEMAPVKITSTDIPTSAETNNNHCHNLSSEKIKKASGDLNLHFNRELGKMLLPNVVRLLPALQIAEILATTRLIGMECPGEHSIYSELALTFTDLINNSSKDLSYEVKSYDERFSVVSIGVSSSSMEGELKAFVRPSPQEQASFAKLKDLVNSREFAGQKALVIGGSRGLGEVASKLLAAGGGRVILTYFRGYAEAQKIVDDILAGGGSAQCVSFDVLQSKANIEFKKLMENTPPTHLYYFSSPFIFEATRGSFSLGLFNKFCKYYVEGLQNTIHQFSGNGCLNVFYPSSVAIDELPQNMGEYAAAKSAGETLCSFLEKTNKKIKSYCPRLPRMATDQTVSFVPVDNKAPAPIILREFRNFSENCQG